VANFDFNPITGRLDLVGTGGTSTGGPDNFSYKTIETGTTVNIPETQEMVHDSDIVIDGTLELDGTTSQLVDYSMWSFGWNTIPSTVALRVKEERDFLFVSPLTVDGILALDGRLIEVA
jgi:hypothetical protein